MRESLLVCSFLLMTCQREPETPVADAASHGASCRGWDVDVPWWVPKLQACVGSVVYQWTYDMPARNKDCQAIAARATGLQLPRAAHCAKRPRQRSFDPLWPIRESHQIIGCPELGPIVLDAMQACARDAVEDAAKRP